MLNSFSHPSDDNNLNIGYAHRKVVDGLKLAVGTEEKTINKQSLNVQHFKLNHMETMSRHDNERITSNHLTFTRLKRPQDE